MYVYNIQMAVKNTQFTKIELRLITYLFKHYKEKLNARQLAKVLSLNHAHVNKLCRSLVDKKLLTKEDLGNAVYFSFPYKRELSLKFMEYLLDLEEFPSWLTVLLHSVEKFKPYLTLGLVFGLSIKTKDFHDLDILLVYDVSHSKEIVRIKDEIRKSGLIEKPIRYVEITEQDILKNKDDLIFYNILSNNLIFHNSSKYVEVIKKFHKLMNI